jgi:hypothetical protein
MQKLLATSAITLIALSGAAFAQSANDGTDADFTQVTDNPNLTGTNTSLLTQILDDATAIQVNMINAAENLANLDGSINVLESANVDDLLRELTATSSFGDGDQLYTWEADGVVTQGDQAAYQAALDAIINDEISLSSADTDGNYTWVVGTGSDSASSSGDLTAFNNAVDAASDDTDIQLYSVTQGDTVEGLVQGIARTVGSVSTTTAVDFFDPAQTVDALQTDITNLTTTVIGALNTGVIGQNGGDNGIAANTLAMANMQLEQVAQTTGSLANSAEYFQPGNLQLANIATNMATVVDASVNVDQLMANVDTVATTLIGALNTGDIATDVNQNASNLTQALVGQ